MKKYKDSDIIKARKLRRSSKYSFNQLQKITGVPATTLKRWCKDEPGFGKSEILRLFNRRKRQEIQQSELTMIPKDKVNSSYAKLLVSLLYWCEGSKYPASNALTFVNSDPLLVKIFITLLRKSFILDESKFSVHMQIHTTHNYEKVKQYWSNILNIRKSRFIKPTTTEKKGGKHRKNYIGTCSLKYQDYRLQLKLIGIYDYFSRNISKYL